MPDPNRPLTVRQVADLLGVAPATVVNYANDGTLKCFVLPSGHRRFHRSEVEKLLSPAPEAAK